MTQLDAIQLAAAGAEAATLAPMATAADDTPKPTDNLMLVYLKFTALDLVGPQHVFSLHTPE